MHPPVSSSEIPSRSCTEESRLGGRQVRGCRRGAWSIYVFGGTSAQYTPGAPRAGCAVGVCGRERELSLERWNRHVRVNPCAVGRCRVGEHCTGRIVQKRTRVVDAADRPFPAHILRFVQLRTSGYGLGLTSVNPTTQKHSQNKIINNNTPLIGYP